MNSLPPKWKFAVIIWIAIYPTITLIFALFGKYLMDIPLPFRTLVLTVFLVPFMVYIAIPVLTKTFSKWMRK